MSTEDNKTIVRRFEEEYHRGNLDAATELLAPDFVVHQPGAPGPMNREAYRQLGSAFLTAFPDLQGVIEDQLEEGDKVVTRLTISGTHRGELFGIPPTDKQMKYTGITIDRLAGGKIAERWVNFDTLGMMQQLGVIPAMG